MQLTSALVNESQLGSRLNHAIESNRRGEFALLLSLMSADARDLAQFHLDQDITGKNLRSKFELPAEQALVCDLSEEASPVNNAPVFQHHGASAFRLQQTLRQEALVIRNTDSPEMAEVLANCDIHTRNRYRQEDSAPKVKLTHFADQLVMQRQMSDLIAQV